MYAFVTCQGLREKLQYSLMIITVC